MKGIFYALFLVLLTASVFAQTPATKTSEVPAGTNQTAGSLLNVVREPVRVPKFSESPVIDGKPDEAVWKSAAVLRDLIQTYPGDHTAPSKETEMYIGYDEKHLYLAFKCFDEKDKIRATVAQRDGVFSEDNVRVWLDTYDDQRRAYILGFNPFGIQADGIYTEGQGQDFNLDILMESKGVIEDWGWSVEVKIPFKSLRYSAGKGKSWGFSFARNIDRFDDEFDSWVPLPRGNPGLLNKFGKLTGLDEIKTERTLEIIPTLTLKETGTRTDQTKFSNPPVEPDFGFTAKFSITPNITLDAAYNPDFADTEADAPVVEANQRFPIFFAEKRPFFLEGVDIFRTPIQAVYTRRVENPDVALKLTGKVGKNSFGVFAAIDEPLFNPKEKKAYAGAIRLKRDIGAESSIGFLATSYTYPEKHNQVAGFDVRWKFNTESEFNLQVLGSTSKNFYYDPDADQVNYRTGNGLNYRYSYGYSKKNVNFNVNGNAKTRDFRTDLGFNQRTDTIQNSARLNLSSDPTPDKTIIRKNFNTSFNIQNDFSGRLQGWGIEAGMGLGLKGSAELNGFFAFGPEAIYEDEFGPKRTLNRPGAFFGDPSRRVMQYVAGSSFYKRFNKRFAVNSQVRVYVNDFDFDFGAGSKFPRVSRAAVLLGQNAPQDPGPGTSLQFEVGANLKPTDNFDIGVGYDKSRLKRNDTKLAAFDANIFSANATYQFSRFVNIRTRVDYNTLNSRVFGQYTFGWTPSPGKALYIGYNDNWNYKGYAFGQDQTGFLQLNRTFFIKLSYLFRRSF